VREVDSNLENVDRISKVVLCILDCSGHLFSVDKYLLLTEVMNKKLREKEREKEQKEDRRNKNIA
jgi:hypothetical protein